ncbi:MAG: hypothetical protein ACRDRQ_20150 [Pseudonocardiaceae bacterium]
MHVNDALRMADLVTQRLSEEFPVAATELLIEPARSCGKEGEFDRAFANSLRRTGFAIAVSRNLSPRAQSVRYQVMSDEAGGLVLQLTINGDATAQYFTRQMDGMLAAAGPITRKTVHQ